MNYKASIYGNPLVPNSLYYCKLLDLHLDASDHPFLWAHLLTGPAYKEYSGARLASITYRTPKSEELLAKFRKTFRVEEDTLDAHIAAIGRWGCVSVVQSEYKCQRYSAPVYVTQNANMRNTSKLLEDREQIVGGIEWPDHVVDVPPHNPHRTS